MNEEIKEIDRRIKSIGDKAVKEKFGELFEINKQILEIVAETDEIIAESQKRIERLREKYDKVKEELEELTGIEVPDHHGVGW